jgi:acetyl esterase
MPPGVTADDVVVPGHDGALLPARVYTPSGPAPAGSGRPLLVRFHGGGWVLGNPRSADWLCGGLAARLDAVLVSVGYRKAPEHRAPIAALDGVAATRALLADAAGRGADPRRSAVLGESAGGNLAAVVAQQLRHDELQPVAQVLMYPGTDATLSSPSIERLRDAPALNRSDIVAFLAHYLGPDGDPTDPLVSPLLATDLRGLPPALVQTAAYDPLLDDGTRYADALRAAGVVVRSTYYPGITHGWVSMARLTPVAEQAMTEAVEFLAEHLAP